MDCRKCGSHGNILLRNKDTYCETCFTANINHKFRACIGKNKILSKYENVMISLSGGASSMVLLELINNGMAMDSHKKLRIKPYFIHLLEIVNGEDDVAAANLVLRQCKEYNFDLRIVSITDYNHEFESDIAINQIPTVDSEHRSQFLSLLKTSQTVANDLQSKIKRDLFIRYAKQMKCKFIFTAEISTTLAINLLSNIAIGRGSQVENDVGFCDNRDVGTKLIRPMRDITNEELCQYIHLKKIPLDVKNKFEGNNSLQTVISDFVLDLQNNFPATISTVCKTADKLGALGGIKGNKCNFCKSDLAAEDLELTALEATNFSRTISCQNPAQFIDHDCLQSLEQVSCNEDMFPYLCYSCSKSCLEINPIKLPKCLQNVSKGTT